MKDTKLESCLSPSAFNIPYCVEEKKTKQNFSLVLVFSYVWSEVTPLRLGLFEMRDGWLVGVVVGARKRG